jgi:hypothetical protein
MRDYASKKSEEITMKAVIRFETEPGYQAQVDWKVLGKHLVDGRWQKLYAFVMVFGYSRKPFVIHTTGMDMATFLMLEMASRIPPYVANKRDPPGEKTISPSSLKFCMKRRPGKRHVHDAGVCPAMPWS